MYLKGFADLVKGAVTSIGTPLITCRLCGFLASWLLGRISRYMYGVHVEAHESSLTTGTLAG